MLTEEIIAKINPKYKESIWSHSITHDSSAQQLEPIYFWIIDFMRDNLGFEVVKLVDNFTASPGGGYFGELGARASKMQDEGIKILGAVNTVLKSVINLLYDLKEFEIRIKQYDFAKSKDVKEKESGILGLKQIWMDKVDMQRGRGSINLMTQEIGFTTLRDAFMAAKAIEDINRMDLNDRVKRILKPRLAEFFEWKDRSEAELRKRFEIEKSYLQNQVGSLKLYTRWVKPYIRAAQELAMSEKPRHPDVVKAFNTVFLELSLLCKKKINPRDAADTEELPKNFRELRMKRDYYACVLIDFKFRGIPSRTQQGHFIFGGRVDASFKSYALNGDELKVLDKELEKEDFQDALKLAELVTEESLAQITEDIEHFSGKKEKGKEEVKKKTKKKEIELELGKIRQDTFHESIIRALAERISAMKCFKVYDIYKKSHGMASFYDPEWQLKQRWHSAEA